MNINIYNSFAGTGKTFNLIKKFLFISIKNKKYNNIILSYTNYSINNIFNKILKNLKDLINYNKKNKILLYLLKKNIKYNKIKKKSIKILKKIFINNNIITLDKFIYNIIIYKTPKIRIQKKYNILNKIDIYIFKYIKLYNNIFNKKNLFFKIKKKINYLLIFKNLINNIYYINNINYVINIFNKYKIVKKKKIIIYKELFYNSYISFIINKIYCNSKKLLLNNLNFYFYKKYIKKYKHSPNIWNNIIYKYNNFFIDEYQDISKYQFKNLISLFKEIIYNKKKKKIYIYTDIYQSIYNWCYNKNYYFINNNINYFNINYRCYKKIFLFIKNFFIYLYKRIKYKNNLFILKTKIKKKGKINLFIIKNKKINIYKKIYNKCKNIKKNKYCILIRNNNQKKTFYKKINIYINKKNKYILYIIIYFIKYIINNNKKNYINILYYLKKIKIINNISINKKKKYNYNIYKTLLKNYNLNINKKKILININNIYYLAKYLLKKINYENNYIIKYIFFKYNYYSYKEFIKFFYKKKKNIFNNILYKKKINILTIHKSKNLEFNIIYLLLLNNKFNNKMKWINYKNLNLFIKKKIFYKIFKKKKFSFYSINLLYVALTRAKKKLYIYIYKTNIYYKYFINFLKKKNNKKLIKIIKI